MRTHHPALAGLLLVTLAPGAHAQAENYATPQAVFDAAQAAQKKQDFKTLVGCFTPEAQKQMAAGLAFAALTQAGTVRADEKLRKQYKLILDALDKHGLGEEAVKKINLKPANAKEAEKSQQQVQGLIKGQAACAAELMAAFSKTEPFNRKPPEMPTPKLTDVKIDGDKAKGTVLIKVMDRELKQPAEFAKVGGGWRLAPVPPPKP